MLLTRLPSRSARFLRHHVTASSVVTSRSAHVIDCRSDTLTQPTQEMKEFMLGGSTGDDVFREDRDTMGNKLQIIHTTIVMLIGCSSAELEGSMAELFGKEAALFVPSGTMGNLISSTRKI